MTAADFSDKDLGKSQTKNALNLLMKPGITSGLFADIPFIAITATFCGCILNILASFIAFALLIFALIIKSVSVAPGHTTVIETFMLFNSYRNPLLKLKIKALLAAYTFNPGTAWCEALLAIFIMYPFCCSFNLGRNK